MIVLKDKGVVPCLGLVDDTQPIDSQIERMMEKINEEYSELYIAVRDYQDTPDNVPQKGKTLEHLLEEAVDLQTVVETLMQILATEKEIKLEKAKVYLKNEIRGYHVGKQEQAEEKVND